MDNNAGRGMDKKKRTDAQAALLLRGVYTPPTNKYIYVNITIITVRFIIFITAILYTYVIKSTTQTHDYSNVHRRMTTPLYQLHCMW